jgi:hypothetical protein
MNTKHKSKTKETEIKTYFEKVIQSYLIHNQGQRLSPQLCFDLSRDITESLLDYKPFKKAN